MGITPILFDSGLPSNFYMDAPIILPCPVRHKKVWWKANEHYFHACKVAICSAYDATNALAVSVVMAIEQADHPREAKRLGRAVPLTPAEIKDWDSGLALVAMLECNLAKYQQHLHCYSWLASTGGAPLVEHRRDKIWGDGLNGTGKNLLGKTLELVRTLVIP